MNVTEDSEKHSVIWGMFMSSTWDSYVFMGKNYSDTLAFHQEYTEDLTTKQMFDISAKFFPNNQMRTMEWKQLIRKTLHGSICLWLVMNKSSVFSAQKSTYFQILFCVLVRYTRTPNQTLHGTKDWSGSKVHRNAEPWTELIVSQWNSSWISSQDSIRCSSVKKFKSYCWD